MAGESDIDAIERGGVAKSADALGSFVNIFAAIGTIWTFLLMFLIVADVIGRSFLSMPITGVAEIAAHSIVAIVFLQLAASIHSGRMTRADFLIDAINRRQPLLAGMIEILFLLAGLAVMLIIAYATWKPLLNAYNAGEFFGVRGVFTIPTWPIRAIIFGGALVAAIAYCAQSVKMLSRLGRMI